MSAGPLRRALGDAANGMPERMPRDDAGLKALAKMLGCAKKDLFVLAAGNDPFNSDTPAKRRDAEWFHGLWTRFGYTSGVHARRVHYQASVQHVGEIRLPNGLPYENDDESWATLLSGSLAARDLGIIHPAMFADRRNQPSRLSVIPRSEPPEPDACIYMDDEPLSAYSRWRLPSIIADLSIYPFTTGRVEVFGYDYHEDDQPYLNELWIEKSTMDDVLLPLCNDLGVNYTPGLGFTSRTRVAEMLDRARRHGKPLRVFVITDYDPAGSAMPRSIARAIEYYRDLLAPDVDIAIRHIGMTRDWIDRYNLPRAPIKAEDRRKANFEAVHGEGCVELDALEALHPGALADEFNKAIRPYRDKHLPDHLRDVETAVAGLVNREWHASTAPIRDELAVIRDDVNTITASYRERLAALARELNAELAPHRTRLDELWTELTTTADAEEFTLMDRPAGRAPGCDESGWLYDSRRHWLDQLDAYHAEKSGAGL